MSRHNRNYDAAEAAKVTIATIYGVNSTSLREDTPLLTAAKTLLVMQSQARKGEEVPDFGRRGNDDYDGQQMARRKRAARRAMIAAKKLMIPHGAARRAAIEAVSETIRESNPGYSMLRRARLAETIEHAMVNEDIAFEEFLPWAMRIAVGAASHRTNGLACLQLEHTTIFGSRTEHKHGTSGHWARQYMYKAGYQALRRWGGTGAPVPALLYGDAAQLQRATGDTTNREALVKVQARLGELVEEIFYLLGAAPSWAAGIIPDTVARLTDPDKLPDSVRDRVLKFLVVNRRKKEDE